MVLLISHNGYLPVFLKYGNNEKQIKLKGIYLLEDFL